MFEGPSREERTSVVGRDPIDQAVQGRIFPWGGREEVNAKN